MNSWHASAFLCIGVIESAATRGVNGEPGWAALTIVERAMDLNADRFSAAEVHAPEQIASDNLRAIYLEWAVAAANGLPSAAAFDPLDHLETAPRWTILDAVPGENDYILRFQGTEVVRLTGIEGTGRRMSEMSDAIGAKLLSRVFDTAKRALNSGRPMLVGPARSAVEGKSWVITTSVTLPLSVSGKALDRVLIIANYDMSGTQ